MSRFPGTSQVETAQLTVERLLEEERRWLRKSASRWAELDVIPEDVYRWLVRRRFFKLFVPKAFGGVESSLGEAVRLYEALAEADGSVAWLVQIGAGGGFFVPSLAPEVAARLFTPEDAVIAGSGAPTGQAWRGAGGYRVRGCWRYASGAQYATLFTAHAVVQGTGEVRAFAFFPEQVCLDRDWRAMGMRATSTWSFRVEDVFVPEELSFVVGEQRWDPGLAVYRLPFELFATASIGAVALGLARAWFRTVQHCDHLGTVWQELRQRQSLLEFAASLFWGAVDEAARAAEMGALERTRAHRLEWLMREALQMVRRLLVEVLPVAGMTVVVERESLGRITRDFLTVCQHRALWSARWGTEWSK